MKRNTVLLTAILAVLLVVAYLVMQRTGEQSVMVDARGSVIPIDSQLVSRIEMTKQGQAVVLIKKGTEWFLESPLRYRAEQTSVAQFIHDIKIAEQKDIVSTNREKQKLFQVDSAGGTVLKIYQNESDAGSVVVGKYGPNYNDTYIRKTNSDEVLLVSAPLAMHAGKQPNEWRDKAILPAASKKPQTITYSYPGEKFTMQFRDSTWYIDPQTADAVAAEGVINSLSNLQCDGFIDTVFSSQAGPAAQIIFDDTALQLFAVKGTENYAVQSSRSPQWFLLNGGKAQQILKKKNDFLKK